MRTIEESRKKFDAIRKDMRLPIIAAPMFLVSGPELVTACLSNKIACGFPTLNARKPEILDDWLANIALDSGLAIPNIIVHRSNPRSQSDLDLIVKHQPPIVISALGHPGPVLEAVHTYGGLVFADVNSMKHAHKAIEAGIDGLVLVCSGAGGHTGQLSPFAFIPEVRRVFSGPIIAGGSVSNGFAIRAMELLGADLVSMGTHFISARESLASDEYRNMLINSSVEDIIASPFFTGVQANYLLPSIEKTGITKEELIKPRSNVMIDDEKSRAKAWKDIWSAGQGVGSTKAILPVSKIVSQLELEYNLALNGKIK
ncbi:nitronate monooxygenase [uncultured Maribacter sp.]|uniref:NAD(P)H-dependent flavin oxidoreductase n=1 Tax=uncultured Maribacter sp. TaxID=431308 RepID=UPI0026031986|nr:nitronate monooxygenase [uncultured Maribacter sp.]